MNFGGNSLILILFLLMFMQGGCGLDSTMLILILFLFMGQGNNCGLCEAK